MTYRIILDSLWDDPRILGLDPESKLAFVYLITNRHAHVSGIYVLAPVIAQDETGLSKKAWDRVSDRVSSAGLCRFDAFLRIVWVVNMFRIQAKGEKADRAAAKHLASLHNSCLIPDFCEMYPSVKQYVDAYVLDRVSDRASLQEQYQEQDDNRQEQETDKSRSASPKPDKFAESISTIVAHFREKHPRARPGKSDKGKIRARLVDGYSAEDLCASIDGMHKTPHNLGQNDRGEKFLTLNLAMREKNVPRFIETNSDPNNGSPLSKNEQKFKRTVQNLKEFGDDRQEGVSGGDGEDGSGGGCGPLEREDRRLLGSPERGDERGGVGDGGEEGSAWG